MKFGHGYLKAYLRRLGHSESDKCQYRNRETPEHLLLSYKELRVYKRRLEEDFKGSRLSLQLLLYTKIRVEKALEFIRELGVATRR